MISKDELSTWDPDIKALYFNRWSVEITVDRDTSMLTFTKDELERLLKEINNAK
jgi:hypothetical protein